MSSLVRSSIYCRSLIQRLLIRPVQDAAGSKRYSTGPMSLEIMFSSSPSWHGQCCTKFGQTQSNRVWCSPILHLVHVFERKSFSISVNRRRLSEMTVVKKDKRKNSKMFWTIIFTRNQISNKRVLRFEINRDVSSHLTFLLYLVKMKHAG